MEWTFRGLAQDGGGGDNVEGIVAPLTFCLQSEVPDSSKALLSAPASLSVWPPFVSLHWDPYNWILVCKGKNMSYEKTLFFLLDSIVRMQKERIEGNSHLFHQIFWMGKPFSNATNAGYCPSWCPGEVLVYNLCPSVTTQSCPNLWQNTEVSGQPKASGANITPGAHPSWPWGMTRRGMSPTVSSPADQILLLPALLLPEYFFSSSLIPKFLHSIDFKGVSAVGQGLVSALGAHLWRKHSLPHRTARLAERRGTMMNYNCLHSSTLAWKNPMDRGAWWAAVSGVAQSRTGLRWLSSSSSIHQREIAGAVAGVRIRPEPVQGSDLCKMWIVLLFDLFNRSKYKGSFWSKWVQSLSWVISQQ